MATLPELRGGVLKAVFALLTVLALFVSVSLAFLARPDWLLGERGHRVLPLLRRLAEYPGLWVRWHDAELGIESLSLLKKKIELRFENVCTEQEQEDPRNIRRVCFERLHLRAIVDFSRFPPRIEELGPGQLIGGTVTVEDMIAQKRPVPQKPISKKVLTEAEESIRLPRFLDGTRLQPIMVEVRSWGVRTPESSVRGTLNLEARTGPAGPPEVQGRLTARLPQRQVVDVEFCLTGQPQGRRALIVQHQIKATYLETRGRNPLRLTLSASGRSGTRKLDSMFNFTAGSDKRPAFLEAKSCSLSLAGGTTLLRCPIHLPFPEPPEKWPKKGLPGRLLLNITADLRHPSFPLAPDEALEGTAKVELVPLQTPYFDISALLTTRFSGKLASFPDGWSLPSDYDIHARLSDLREVIHSLRKTSWAVPAPFNVLDGSAEVRVQGSGDLLLSRFPVAVSTRFHSKTERIDIDATGTVTTAGFPPTAITDIEGKAILNAVQLQLPRLELGLPPQIFGDPRFTAVTEAPRKAKRKPPPMGLRLTLQTAPGNPAKIITNLAKAPVPVAADLLIEEEEPLKGRLSIDEFPIRAFRRNATLEKFVLELKRPGNESTLNGSIRVVYPDYTVRIYLAGTLGKPVVQLESDPPLPSEQLVAALLFGRPLEQLDPDQTASVGSVRSALAEGAFTAASLYVLASTPIQSVVYDPTSGTFSVRIRLAQGTTLNVGSGAGSPVIGLQKRLGPHWTIRTDLTSSKDPNNPSTVSAFIEWNNRY